MDIKMREVDEVAVLSLSGRLDLANGSTLKDQLKQLFANNKTSIHLNLADVEFINSSGLGALVSIMKEVRLIKGRLTLSNPASYVQEIFEITQLSHIFEIYSTEEEALSSFHTTPVKA
ncbi:MAG: STAS domain-containing protein [bacterium]|nr:STAS domain-containing protein [bacterium]